jgi:hypothetical protein
MQTKPTTRVPQAGVFECPVCESTWTDELLPLWADDRAWPKCPKRCKERRRLALAQLITAFLPVVD